MMTKYVQLPNVYHETRGKSKDEAELIIRAYLTMIFAEVVGGFPRYTTWEMFTESLEAALNSYGMHADG